MLDAHLKQQITGERQTIVDQIENKRAEIKQFDKKHMWFYQIREFEEKIKEAMRYRFNPIPKELGAWLLKHSSLVLFVDFCTLIGSVEFKYQRSTTKEERRAAPRGTTLKSLQAHETYLSSNLDELRLGNVEKIKSEIIKAIRLKLKHGSQAIYRRIQ